MKTPRTLLALIALLVAAVAALASVEYTKLARAFYAQIVESESRGVRDRLNMHLSPALSSLNLSGKLLSQTQAKGFEPDSPDMTVLSALADERAVDAAALRDGAGLAALAVRLEDGFALYVRPDAASPQGKRMHLDQAMQPTGPQDIPDSALKALDAEIARSVSRQGQTWPAWSGILPLPVSGKPAVTTTSLAGASGPGQRTLSFGFTIEQVRGILLGEQIAEDLKPLLFTPDGLMLDLDAVAPAQHQRTPLFVPSHNVEDPVRTGAMTAWLGQGKPVGLAFSFSVAGNVWWAALQPLSEEPGGASAGLVVSQQALLSLLLSDNRAPLLLAGGVFCVLVLLALLAFQLKRRQRGARAFFDAPGDVLTLLAQGESERLEFKSTLRQNLAAGKPGKEIELACLKTLTAYMNTEGGVLVVGVDDAGVPLGLDADGFENDDHLLRHFGSMFAQHVGTEFMRLVRFALRSTGEQQVFIVECEPSKDPVFLRGAKEEEFYVRAGPSSRRLSMSEFYRRITRPGKR